MEALEILYEDNHLIAINKKPGEISQGDKTGDVPLVEKIKSYLRETYQKPGNVYAGLVHRVDRPVSGVLLFAKTGKANERLNAMLRDREIHKTYWAVVKNKPTKNEDTLVQYLVKNAFQNKSYVHSRPVVGSKEAILHYKLIASSDRYYLLEVTIETGRHHQIRAQLAAMGCPIRGDLKYGYPRSNPDKSIHLHARSIRFTHPVKKEEITIVAPPPNEVVWNAFMNNL